jgi:hypothetical protein
VTVERFGAPWGTTLSIMTPVGVIALLGLPVAMAFVPANGPAPTLVVAVTAVVVVATVGVSALFLIRGYRLDDRGLHVERLLWADRIPLTTLRRAWPDHEATAKSLRLFGNSGFFCIAGLFTNRKLGRYRAFATDVRRAVVLRMDEGTVVVTPDEPLRFLAAIRSLAPQAEVADSRA